MTSFWAVVPAAGSGRRLGGAVPKQYLPLAGQPLIEHGLATLLGHPGLRGLVVALAPDDPWWPATACAAHPRVLVAPGGDERARSVLNGLQRLVGQADPQDWVLVHDAARPCLRPSDLEWLLAALADHPVGGLLGIPARDTLKRADRSGTIQQTLARDGLWHAQTPQMFRFEPLRQALGAALDQGLVVTDEAQAMELAGHRPLLVEGGVHNLKVTRAEDMELAAYYLGRG